uniref:Putative secreted protein n=1 Tax=Anopheles darlingi TaxID=43151 RepID=A0A2M4DNP1_ANODA
MRIIMLTHGLFSQIFTLPCVVTYRQAHIGPVCAISLSLHRREKVSFMLFANLKRPVWAQQEKRSHGIRKIKHNLHFIVKRQPFVQL